MPPPRRPSDSPPAAAGRYHGFSLRSVCWGYREIFREAIEGLFEQGAIGPERQEVTRHFFELMKHVNILLDAGELRAQDRMAVLDFLAQADSVLGLKRTVGATLTETWRILPSQEEIERLVAEREQARADRDFARADEIRAQLAAQDIILEDTTDGTIWRRQ